MSRNRRGVTRTNRGTVGSRRSGRGSTTDGGSQTAPATPRAAAPPPLSDAEQHRMSVEANRKRVDEMFGNPDIENRLQALRRRAEGFYAQQSEQGYSAARRASRQNLARSGLAGGSVAKDQRRRSLGEYISARQQASLQADELVEGARTNITGLKRQALDQVYQNPTIPLDDHYTNQQMDFVNRATRMIPQQVVGGLFSHAGGMIEASAVAEGRGRRGFGFYGGSGTASTTGTTTG